MAKSKSSLFETVSSMFSTSAAAAPVPSSGVGLTSSKKYNKDAAGESFEGEKSLVATVFSTDRLNKMHRLAKDHQNALSASDIIDLRKMGVAVNKSLVSDYSKYVSMKQQNGNPSENFTKWLNVKTGPSMMEAPTMFVLQYTQPGKAVNKVEIGAFGPSGLHYAETSAESDSKPVVYEASGPVYHAEVTKDELKTVLNLIEHREKLAKLMREDAESKGDQTLIDKLTGIAKRLEEIKGDVKGATNKSVEDINASMELCKDIKSNARNFIQEFDADLKQLNVKVEKNTDNNSSMDTESGTAQALNTDSGSAYADMSPEMQTAMVNKAADALMQKQSELDRYEAQIETIKKHIKSTGAKSAKGLKGMDQVANHVHSICKQLMVEREKNERLMAQSIHGGGADADADTAPLLRRAMDSLTDLNEKNEKLKHDNDVFSKEAKDLQAALDHLEKTKNTLVGQNMDYKRAAAREQYEKDMHRVRAADLGQKLASTLHYHFTDENGDGNATVFLKATKDCCGCDEFDRAAERNEVEGAVLVGSTQTMLGRFGVGERTRMDIHNCSGLTDASGEVITEVGIERINDKSDGTMRGRLTDTVMLGKHTIQSEVYVTGENQDHYALTLNAR